MNKINNLLKICLTAYILGFSSQVWAGCAAVTAYYCDVNHLLYGTSSACNAVCSNACTLATGNTLYVCNGSSSYSTLSACEAVCTDDDSAGTPPPEPDFYTLSVTGSQAHITSTPSGIDCEYGEGSCSKLFDRGQTVTLELVKIDAVAGLTQDDYIIEWFGDSGCSNQKVIMNANRNCAVRLYGKPGVDYSGNTSTDTSTDPNTDPNTDTSTDPNTDTSTDPNTDTSTDPNTGTNTSGNAIPPIAPTQLQATSKTDNSIELSWLDNSNNEAGFYIYRNNELLQQVTENITNTVILNLTCQTGYTFQVIAFNGAGQASSEIISTTTAICPPDNFAVTALTSNQVQLSWRDNSVNETGFPIARNGQFIEIASANSEQFIDNNVTCGTEYIYHLYATDSIINVGGLNSVITPVCESVSENNFTTNALPIAKMGAELCGMAFTNQNLTTGNLKICSSASVTGGHLIGENVNSGVISNFILDENATISGGRVSGFNTNYGTLQDVTITSYTEVTGGFYSGLINNNGTMTNNVIQPNTTVYSSSGQGKIAGVTQNKGTIQGTIRLSEDSWLIGGTITGTVIGSKKAPAYIGATTVQDGATLQNVYLSPTVQLPKNIRLINVKRAFTFNLSDFLVNAEQLDKLNAKTIVRIEPVAISLLDRYEAALIPANAFAGISPEQLAAFNSETLNNLSIEQFAQLPLSSLNGLTSTNIDALSPEIIRSLTPEQLDALSIEAVQQSEKIAKLLTNVAATTPRTIVNKILPQNWQISPLGKITAPVGSKLGFRGMVKRFPNRVLMPYLIDSKSYFSVSGNIVKNANTIGGGLNIGLQQTPSIDTVDLDQFIFTQNEYGIFNVVGTGDYEGIVFAFMPNANNIEQAPLDTPVGLTTIEGGYFEMITPDKQKFILITAPNNPVGLQQALGGESTVKLSPTGDVLMRLDTSTNNRRRVRFETNVMIVGCFDAFVEPAPKGFCKNPQFCDFGMEFPLDFANLRAKQEAKVIYPDGTAQTIYPTVIYPETLVNLLQQYDVISKVLYKSDGTFEVVVNGQKYNLLPDINIKVRRLDAGEKHNPKVNLQGNVLFYEVQEGDDLLTFSLDVER